MDHQYKLNANQHDPTRKLSHKAMQLLEAARRIVVDRGFNALSIDSVASEAGAYKNSVRYYFGSKAGLVAALFAVEVPADLVEETVAAATAVPPGSERVRRQLEGWRKICEDRDSMRAFFEILPHALREPELRRQIADLYRSYRETDIALFAVPSGIADAEVEALAALVAAAGDGLAAQLLMGPDGSPDGVDSAKVFQVLEEMVDAYLERLRGVRS